MFQIIAQWRVNNPTHQLLKFAIHMEKMRVRIKKSQFSKEYACVAKAKSLISNPNPDFSGSEPVSYLGPAAGLNCDVAATERWLTIIDRHLINSQVDTSSQGRGLWDSYMVYNPYDPADPPTTSSSSGSQERISGKAIARELWRRRNSESGGPRLRILVEVDHLQKASFRPVPTVAHDSCLSCNRK
ncbi:hypothetical protein ACH5RR_010636 [Cinchona calisaya]|uniref:Uncharacterized protein n=1 Tax=Cinchona calisaya TaxID=153742 RepID=A0ABD3AJH0_9GENT